MMMGHIDNRTADISSLPSISWTLNFPALHHVGTEDTQGCLLEEGSRHRFEMASGDAPIILQSLAAL